MGRLCAIACSVWVSIAILAGCASGPQATPKPTASDAETLAAAKEKTAERHSMTHRILLYLPNRILDLTDVVSVNGAIPFIPKYFFAGLHVNARASRVVQAGFGSSSETICIGKGYPRRLMPWVEERYEASLGPATFCKHKIGGRGKTLEYMKTGIMLPGDEPFAEGLMDYWAIGGEATALIVAVRAEAHPVEIFDALAGFLLMDPRGDDF